VVYTYGSVAIIWPLQFETQPHARDGFQWVLFVAQARGAAPMGGAAARGALPGRPGQVTG